MKLVSKYFPDLSELQYGQIEALYELYNYWNQRINVISRKDMEALLVHHVLHSMAAALWVQWPPASRILDLGTGGGFPGIPLAILFPQVQFHLIDARQKKITVVREVVKAIQLRNVVATHGRVEEMAGQFDAIVTRAVAPLATLYKWSSHLLSNRPGLEGGILSWKGGDLESEIAELDSKMRVRRKRLDEIYTEDYFQTKYLIHINPH